MPGSPRTGPGTKGQQDCLVLPEPVVGDTFAGSRIKHGTESGWRQHTAVLDEEACEQCRLAKARADQRRRGATQKTLRNRANARAQSLALQALRRAHPEEYRALYLAEKHRLWAEGDLGPMGRYTWRADL